MCALAHVDAAVMTINQAASVAYLSKSTGYRDSNIHVFGPFTVMKSKVNGL